MSRIESRNLCVFLLYFSMPYHFTNLLVRHSFLLVVLFFLLGDNICLLLQMYLYFAFGLEMHWFKFSFATILFCAGATFNSYRLVFDSEAEHLVLVFSLSGSNL